MRKKRLPCYRVIPLTLLLFIYSFSFAQTKTISGKITDATDGTGLPGVTIIVKGTKAGAQTKSDGSFSINIPPSATTLVISSIGYTQKEIPIAGSDFNISLVKSVGPSLNDVVVIGYGTVRQKDLTGAVATVTSKDFQQGAAITSPDELIAGKVAGVSVTSNGGQPGAAATVRIRGLSSLSGNNDPLYVIDGVPMQPAKNPDGTSTISGVSDPLSMINPNDIESETVLKDASAAAIYGSRASSGVIIITTKRGKSGAPKFNFNTQLGASVIAKEESVLNTEQLKAYVNANGTPAQIAEMGGASTDWQHEIYQTGIISNSNLSMSGSLKNLPYYVSFGYLDQQGILKTDALKRTTTALRLSPSLFDNHLKIDFNFNYSHQNTRFANQAAIGAAANFAPTQPIYQKGSPFGGYFEWTTGNDSTPNTNATKNPVALLNQYNSTSTADRYYGNLQLDYKVHFLPDLHASLNLGYDKSLGQGSVHVPGDAAQQWGTTTNHGQNYSYKSTNNFYNESTWDYIKNFPNVFEFKLNYLKDLPDIKSNINLLAGYGYYNNLTTNYNYPSLDSKGDTIPGTAPLYPYSIAENTLISYFGRLIYTYDNKYILTASIRSDGSSRFPTSNRYGIFPAVAGAWKISEEDFLKNSTTISSLKLRASYGVTGNQDGIGNYGYIPSYYLSSNGSQYQFGNQFYYLYTPSPYDANIKWEQTASTNIGIDYGFLHNRITGSIEYYYKNTKDLINTIFIPDGTNFTNQETANIGKMVSKGAEFTISAVAVQSTKVTWNLSFNFAYEDIKITNLTNNQNNPNFYGDAVGGISGGTGNTIQMNTVGYSPQAFFVLQQIYDQKSGKPIEGLYVDRNRDGIISSPPSSPDAYHYKSPFAPVIMGFSTAVSYEKWSLSTVLRANIGNYVYNNVAANMAVQRSILNPNNFISNTLTSYSNTNFINNQYFSDYYVENGSFLKMDNLMLNYNLGSISNGKARVNISASVQNVFVVTKYSGIDPEIYGGIDNNIYPKPRTYTLGVNVGF
ncbi:MAG TPA: SusC/RagA family TonB-linked outer membrane protein [Puia sp.]|nr:SusC/RagA family TonB-linked outer membrane protein [Puia sp.]